MFYANFLYFIVSIILFSTAPAGGSRFFTVPQNLLWIAVVLLVFWQMNRNRFLRVRIGYDNRQLGLNQLKREFSRITGIHTIAALLLFALEIFVFDLKAILAALPVIGRFETLLNAFGVMVFFLHLVIVWVWGYRALGEHVSGAPSVGRHVAANVKFYLIIILPWLILSLALDLLFLVEVPGWRGLFQSALFQLVFVSLLLLAITALAPLLITRLWDCRPLDEGPLKEEIRRFGLDQGVEFRDIMSWNALNRGLVTAGVVGLFRPVRYLLITPGLMEVLDRDEIMAVVSHEVGHVRKKHLLFYLLFFIGFILLVLGVLDRLLHLFLNSSLGFSMIVTPGGDINLTLLSLLRIFLSITLFVLYFRFVFGFFMRNFERQADGFCFQSGVDPRSLIASFRKLGLRIGDDGRRANWHHYSIGERIDFLERSIDDPGLVVRHDRGVRRSLIVFFSILLVFSAVSFNPYASRLDSALLAGVMEHFLERDPQNPVHHATLGMLHYEQGHWREARDAFETSLRLEPRQPDVMNNLAWLLLTCPEKSILDPRRALRLAESAAALQTEAHILDTLAEAYRANDMYREAVIAARRALALARENRSYYVKQLKKMTDAYRHLGDSVAI